MLAGEPGSRVGGGSEESCQHETKSGALSDPRLLPNPAGMPPDGALGDSGGHIKKFHRDTWTQPWPPGPEMQCYMLSHEAHHRGQVFLLARQLGFPLPKEVGYGIWN
jgi:hypothetical protein